MYYGYKGYGSAGASTRRRSTKGFTSVSGSPREDIDDNNYTLRQRGRLMYMGNPIAASAIKTHRTNTIGLGLRLNPRPDADFLGMTPEQMADWVKTVKREFSLWASHKDACDATGINDFYEFQQLMLGSLSPTAGIIFNEKLYRWSHFVDAEGEDAFSRAGYDDKTAGQALETHAGHGPFTTARPSYVVEEVLDGAACAGSPCQVTYDDCIFSESAPEFVKTYLTWLRDERGVDAREPMTVGMFAHSSNGGICIGADGQTDVAGLYACGECAGGVHGADRIGGLASLTAATFGRYAGIAAAECARERRGLEHGSCTACSELRLVVPDEGLRVRREVGRILDHAAMVVRSGDELRAALRELGELERDLDAATQTLKVPGIEGVNEDHLALLCWGRDASARILMAKAILRSCLERNETRGPHYRVDCPQTDARQAKPQVWSLADIESQV